MWDNRPAPYKNEVTKAELLELKREVSECRYLLFRKRHVRLYVTANGVFVVLVFNKERLHTFNESQAAEFYNKPLEEMKEE